MALTQQEQTNRQIVEKLGQLGGKLTTEESILRGGDKIQVPEKLPLAEAAQVLSNIAVAEEEPTNYIHKFKYRPWDGAVAFVRVVKNTFGVTIQKGTPGFFGKTPPMMIDVAVSPAETIQVPWGIIVIPTLPGTQVQLGSAHDDEFGEVFSLTATAPRKYRSQINGLFMLVEQELAEHSIYRGKAFDGASMPNFVNTDKIDASKVVYSDELSTQLDANLWSAIRHHDKLERYGLPTKRAVAFVGKYGNGKSLAIGLTAKEAVAAGWTFILCRPQQDDLNQVLQTATLYEPAVVAFEDIDVVINAEEHDAGQISFILDRMDGVTAKGRKLICVFTTNHPDKLHKGMLRPGRLDAVLTFGPLDQNGVKKMVEGNIPAGLLGEVDFTEVYNAMVGFEPAFVREAIDRTKRYAMARTGGNLEVVVTADLVHAAAGLRPQLEMMESAGEHKRDTSLETTIAEIVRGEIKARDNNR